LTDITSAPGADPVTGLHRRAVRLEQFSIGWMLIVLAAYVLIGSAIELAARAHPERSPVGIGLTVGSLLVMPLLGWRKRHVGTSARRWATRSSWPTPPRPCCAPRSPPRPFSD
jgi:hypothetical protein